MTRFIKAYRCWNRISPPLVADSILVLYTPFGVTVSAGWATTDASQGWTPYLVSSVRPMGYLKGCILFPAPPANPHVTVLNGHYVDIGWTIDTSTSYTTGAMTWNGHDANWNPSTTDGKAVGSANWEDRSPKGACAACYDEAEEELTVAVAHHQLDSELPMAFSGMRCDRLHHPLDQDQTRELLADMSGFGSPLLETDFVGAAPAAPLVLGCRPDAYVSWHRDRGELEPLRYTAFAADMPSAGVFVMCGRQVDDQDQEILAWVEQIVVAP
jgi:hypothetical protein